MNSLTAYPPTSSVRPSWPILQRSLLVMLFIAGFTGFQNGRYFAGNIVQELGILCSGGMFLVGTVYSWFSLSRREWNRWVLLPTLLCAFIVIIWALVFVLRYGGNVSYNLMASREFFFIFLAPGIYLCGRCGLPLRQIQACFWAILIASMINYLFFYNQMDLKAAFFSTDHRISTLITFDEWRGFRLKPPLFAMMIGLLAAFAVIFGRASARARMGALFVASMAIYIWSIVLFRSTLATMLISVILFPVILISRSRMHLVMVAAPVLMLLAPIIGFLILGYFTSADGGDVRLAAYIVALQEIPQVFFFGVGEDTAFGQTYQDLFGPKFFPSDLGIIGITFKYGTIGLVLYLFFHFTILWRLAQVHWLLRQKGESNPLVWAFLLFFCAQTFNLILNPGLAYAQGITVAAMAVAHANLILQMNSKS